MFDQFIKNLHSFLPFTDEELAFFLTLFETRVVKKNDCFTKIGQHCNYVAYINKGLMRYYYVMNDKEHIARIFLENEWTGDYAAFLTKTPSTVNIEALEECELFLLSYTNMQRAYDKGKNFERFGRLMAEALFIDTVERSSDLLMKTPEALYLTLLQKQPEIINRVPLKHIASLLGIEPESLSRIRKRTTSRA